MAILEIRDVTAGYGEVQILWGVSLALEEGRLTSLVGTNGAGKTTLLRTAMGLNRPWEGSVWFDGLDVTRLSPHAKAERGLVLVPDVMERTPPYIDFVRPGFPAAEAQLKPDDLILLVGDRLIQSCKDLKAELEYIDRLDPLRITVLRDQELIEVTLQAPESGS